MNHDEAMRRAARANDILGDELVVEAFAMMERDLLAVWRQTKDGQSDLRERAYLALKTLDRFKEQFGRLIAGGKFSAADMLAAEKRKRFGVI